MSKVKEETGVTFLLTVTEQMADFPPAVAVMVTVPAATAVTVPLLTVATDWLDVDQLTALFVALEGLTVAVRLAVPPISRVSELWSRETPVTAITGSSFGPQAAIRAKHNNKQGNMPDLIEDTILFMG